MVNPSTGNRELAYVITIDEIQPLPNCDRIEYARTNGWWVIVKKEDFHVGDKAVYIEIDARVPATSAFTFLEKYKYKVKTQKMRGVYSQGLLLRLSDLGLNEDLPVGTFLTEKLGITYADPADNERKDIKPKKDKYQKMFDKHPKFAKSKFWRSGLMKRILFLFLGEKKSQVDLTDFPSDFPYVRRTDVERVENMPLVLKDKTPCIVTQKCDGMSSTYILERKKKGKKFEFYVCSRNKRVFRDSATYHDKNYYWDAADKYHIEEVLTNFLTKRPELDYVALQGEICAPGIQGNPHKLKELHLFAFHFITSDIGKWDIRDARKIWENHGIEYVPIVCEDYILPDDLAEFKKEADGNYAPSVCEGQTNCAREGYVYYRTSNPNVFFKNVSNKYLEKHAKKEN